MILKRLYNHLERHDYTITKPQYEVEGKSIIEFKKNNVEYIVVADYYRTCTSDGIYLDLETKNSKIVGYDIYTIRNIKDKTIKRRRSLIKKVATQLNVCDFIDYLNDITVDEDLTDKGFLNKPWSDMSEIYKI